MAEKLRKGGFEARELKFKPGSASVTQLCLVSDLSGGRRLHQSDTIY